MTQWEYVQIRSFYTADTYILIVLPDGIVAAGGALGSKKLGATIYQDRRALYLHLAKLYGYPIPASGRMELTDAGFLNIFGFAGWELVAGVTPPLSEAVMYMKRPIQGSGTP